MPYSAIHTPDTRGISLFHSRRNHTIFRRCLRNQGVGCLMRSVALFRVAFLGFGLLAGLSGAVRAEDADDATMKLGQRTFLLCQSCHSLEENGKHRVGPNLWHVFGAKAGSKEGFLYSDTLKKSN